MAHWTPVLTVGELPTSGFVSVRTEHHRLAVGRTEDGRLAAFDDRCPHEGYPLHQGVLRGCVLTCAWHNWKFDTVTGANEQGGEGLTTWPVRERDGQVEVDLRPPPKEALLPALWSSLQHAVFEHDIDQGSRDVVRLLQLGVKPQAVLAWLAAYDARHARWGSTHALPVCADLLPVLGRLQGVHAVHPLLAAVDLTGQACRRLPARVRATPVDRGSQKDFVRLVERENADLAEAVIRAAVARGDDAFGWLYAATSEHFTGFGHSLIFLIKAQELAPHLDREQLADVLGGATVALVNATREDTLPYWRKWSQRDQDCEPLVRAEGDAPVDAVALRDLALAGAPAEAHAAFVRALGTSRPEPVADALVAAAAWRLLRFDARIDGDPDVAEGWLWATHRLTFALAARRAVARWRDPRALRFVLQALAFVRTGAPMDGPDFPAGDWWSFSQPGDVLEAVERWDDRAAVARLAAVLEDGDPSGLLPSLQDAAWGDRFVTPIHMAHALKTLQAGWEAWRDLPADQPDRAVPLLAAVRHLASPRRERSVQALARRARRWVAEGERIRKLTQ